MRILIFISIILITNICNAKDLKKDIALYESEASMCEENYKKNARAAQTTAEMIESSYKAVDCYTDLINKIIDKQYSQNAPEHKEALNNYIEASFALNALIYQTPDKCFPRCGSMYNVISKSKVAYSMRELVKEYLKAIPEY